MYFKPINDEIQRVFNNLTKVNATIITPRIALDIGRNKNLKQLRKNDNLFIAHDRKKNKSLIYLPPHVKVKPYKNGFKIEFF